MMLAPQARYGARHPKNALGLKSEVWLVFEAYASMHEDI